MTKMVFIGNASRTRGTIKNSASLEETLLHCETCKLNTIHIYKRVKGQHPNLTFIYECKDCGTEYHSDRRF